MRSFHKYEVWLLNNRTDAATSALQAYRDKRRVVNRTVSGYTFPTLSSLDKLVARSVKSALKGTRSESVEAVKAKATEGSESADRSGLPALLSTMEKSYGTVSRSPR
ncbi:hypothetical protein NQ318_012080 [Aromia moschata]|uniref:Uncharacterized protein n=1 Tax=Aromia moschata TaxID=1265417 RepID=A0AAV8X272_9CUCU|nr:hypothetical protein NQ318_012080 [Aromia moschata]